MKTPISEDVAIYRSLSRLSRGFDDILCELEQLQQDRRLRKWKPIKSVALAIRETHAWALFETLEALHDDQQRRWTRLGRQRQRESQSD